jgi:H+/Cl- antiporter ClcA
MKSNESNLFQINLNFKHPLYYFKWSILICLIGIVSGSCSAWFLLALDYATTLRENNLNLIYFLPLAGLAIVYTYKHFGKNSGKGNNLIISEIQEKKEDIPFIMAPLIFFGTIITHLFGGSAGREGSAVQMGGSFADYFSKLFSLGKEDRKIILICGISAGFASVFGTPLAGAIFAIETIFIGHIIWRALFHSLITAFIAYFVCNLWNIHHSYYEISIIPSFNIINLLYTALAGILFGLVAKLTSFSLHQSQRIFQTYIKKDYLRPVIGACIIVIFFMIWGNTDYLGLGLPKISESFNSIQPQYAFLIKIALTAITLGAGFKGGEVTPLFFIGATLGSALSGFIDLPTGLLAGMGFVAVFTAAANAPLACILMGIELFGTDAAIYITIACVVAYFTSGHQGIYSSQIIKNSKYRLLKRKKS